MATQQHTVSLNGGLVTNAAIESIREGNVIACTNFEPTLKGMERSSGYERFDGQPLASSIATVTNTDGTIDDTAREAQRALIQPVPGSGAILGLFMLNGTVYAFRNDASGTSAKLYKSSAAGWVLVTTPTLQPSGKYRTTIYNFKATAGTAKVYGVDGVNPPFEFDGSTFTQITHGAEPLQPTSITAHAFHLFIGFKEGSIMHSETGNPLGWNVTNGAGEIGTGDAVTDLKSMVNDALLIMCKNKLNILYGTGAVDWQSANVRPFQEGVGGLSDTVQLYGQLTLYVDGISIKSIQAVTTFGNFAQGNVSTPIEDGLKQKLGKVIGSCVEYTKNQYRLFLEFGTNQTEVITLYIRDDGVPLFGRQVLGCRVSAITSGDKTDGSQGIYFGTTDGFVMAAESGTSQDGQPIEATMLTAFSPCGGLTQRKRFKRVRIISEAADNVVFNIKPEFASVNTGEFRSTSIKSLLIHKKAELWGLASWGGFEWSETLINIGRASIDGNGISIALVINNASKYNTSFVVNSYLIEFIPRRGER